MVSTWRALLRSGWFVLENCVPTDGLQYPTSYGRELDLRPVISFPLAMARGLSVGMRKGPTDQQRALLGGYRGRDFRPSVKSIHAFPCRNTFSLLLSLALPVLQFFVPVIARGNPSVKSAVNEDSSREGERAKGRIFENSRQTSLLSGIILVRRVRQRLSAPPYLKRAGFLKRAAFLKPEAGATPGGSRSFARFRAP